MTEEEAHAQNIAYQWYARGFIECLGHDPGDDAIRPHFAAVWRAHEGASASPLLKGGDA